jgi:hypothetical protein
MTWMCILMNAGGGLLVGCVISYADAVTKDVAIGASIGVCLLILFRSLVLFLVATLIENFADADSVIICGFDATVWV